MKNPSIDFVEYSIKAFNELTAETGLTATIPTSPAELFEFADVYGSDDFSNIPVKVTRRDGEYVYVSYSNRDFHFLLFNTEPCAQTLLGLKKDLVEGIEQLCGPIQKPIKTNNL